MIGYIRLKSCGRNYNKRRPAMKSQDKNEKKIE